MIFVWVDKHNINTTFSSYGDNIEIMHARLDSEFG